jgi:hypothetical protein
MEAREGQQIGVVTYAFGYLRPPVQLTLGRGHHLEALSLVVGDDDQYVGRSPECDAWRGTRAREASATLIEGALTARTTRATATRNHRLVGAGFGRKFNRSNLE